MHFTLQWSVSGLEESKKTGYNYGKTEYVNAANVRYDSKACCWVDDSGHYYDIEDWQNGVIRK